MSHPLMPGQRRKPEEQFPRGRTNIQHLLLIAADEILRTSCRCRGAVREYKSLMQLLHNSATRYLILRLTHWFYFRPLVSTDRVASHCCPVFQAINVNGLSVLVKCSCWTAGCDRLTLGAATGQVLNLVSDWNSLADSFFCFCRIVHCSYSSTTRAKYIAK